MLIYDSIDHKALAAHPFFLEIPLERSNFSSILSLTTLDLEGSFSSFIKEEIRK